MLKEQKTFLNNVLRNSERLIKSKGTHIDSNIVKLNETALIDNKGLSVAIAPYFNEFTATTISNFKKSKKRTILTWKLWVEYLQEILGA